MAWDFSIEGAHHNRVREQLEKGLTSEWQLPQAWAATYWTRYEQQGLAATSLDELTEMLYTHRGLYIFEVLEYLGFETQYERRSKQVNPLLIRLFLAWHEDIYTQNRPPIDTYEGSIILTKAQVVEILDWLFLCACWLNDQASILKNYSPEWQLAARANCTNELDEEEGKAFAFDQDTYASLKETFEATALDCFYWWHSY